MCPGVCKDRLADAFDRFGRVPIEKRKLVVPPDHSAFRAAEDPFWAAGGLLHDGRGRVLLIRHVAAAGWGDAWLTPGGRLEEGETTVDGLRREVREEVGLDVTEPVLDRKSTRLNSSHLVISYAVFCLKKKNGPPCMKRKMTERYLSGS